MHPAAVTATVQAAVDNCFFAFMQNNSSLSLHFSTLYAYNSRASSSCGQLDNSILRFDLQLSAAGCQTA